MQIDAYLSPCTKLLSNQIKDLNVKSDTLNLIEDKVANSLEHIGTWGNFLSRIPMAQALRSIIDKWNLLRLTHFCKAKDMVSRTKQTTSILGKDLQ